MSDIPSDEFLAHLCGGEGNVLDGCQVHFSRIVLKQELCPKCKKLNAAASETERESIRGMTQCGECAIVGTKVTDPCGTCIRTAHQSKEKFDAAERRRDATNMRMKKGNTTPAAAGATTPEVDLSALRTGVGKVGLYTFSHSCRRSDGGTTIDKSLGTGCVPYTEGMSMIDLHQAVLREANLRWCNTRPAGLLLEETELRGPKNITMDVMDPVRTIQEYYAYHKSLPNSEAFLVPAEGMKKIGKDRSFQVELFIDVDRYNQRVADGDSEDDNFVAKPNSRKQRHKRKATTNLSISMPRATTAKRTREPPLQTTFAPEPLALSSKTAERATRIRFRRTICTIQPYTAYPSFNEDAALESGLLQDSPLALPPADQGRTKDVYRLIIQNKEYIAKRVYNIGEGRADIPVETAWDVLLQDLTRLKRLAYYAGRFMEEVYRNGADIDVFSVSDAFVIKVFQESQAQDGDSEPEFDENGKAIVGTAVYLVEPRRLTSHAKKYSGTTTLTTENNKQAATLMAFVHYIFVETGCNLLFADIQGSLDRTAEGQPAFVLFDPMTHTPDGSSGLGDHGRHGLQLFIDEHVCNYICRSLKLASRATLQETLNAIGSAVTDDDDL